MRTSYNRSKFEQAKDSMAKNRMLLILTEVDLGLTFCRIGRRYNRYGQQTNLKPCIANARKAYQMATRCVLRANLPDVQFNRLTAKLELLKFEVEALEKAVSGIGPGRLYR